MSELKKNVCALQIDRKMGLASKPGLPIPWVKVQVGRVGGYLKIEIGRKAITLKKK